MRIARSAWLAVINAELAPSAPRTTGPILPTGPAGLTSAAPAPSARRAAVARSSGSVSRLSRSAPITSTLSARPDSIWAVASPSADRKPAHAAPTSIAPAAVAPSSSATSGAAFGVSSSAAMVATRTRSSSPAATPARSSAIWPASAANALRRSSGHAMRRRSTPVRFVIQLGSTPIRSAIGAFSITRSGTHIATEAMPAPRRVRAPSIAASREALASSGTRHLPLGQDARLDLGKRAPHEALQDLAGADLHEPLGAPITQCKQGVAPAHRPHQGLRQLGPDVAERTRRDTREHRHPRGTDVDSGEGLAELGHGLRHRVGVERAADREPHRLQALGLRLVHGGVQVFARPRDDELARRIVVCDSEPVSRGDAARHRLIAEQREHPAGWS